MTSNDLMVETRHGVGHLILNRPRAINALTPPMLEGIHEALDAWSSDGSIGAVQISGAGERGLCSGADVRALRQVVLDGGDYMEFFRVEYGMNAAIKNFCKPYIAHMRGITMGGGLGVSAHGSRRVAYTDSVFAMPETIIGFTPDVGILWYLAQAPGEVGVHVALTGSPINATDAVFVGLADEISGEAPRGELAESRGWIDECYASDDPAEVIGRLEQHADERARAAAADIRQRCPLSVAATLEAVRRVRSMSGVEEVLAQDMVLARHLIPGADFVEGVRAQLVDKDRQPRWQHARIEDVSRAEVLAAFGEA